MNRSLPERSYFLDRRLSQTQHDIRVAQASHPIIDYRSPSAFVFRIAAMDRTADPYFNCDFSAERRQFLYCFRHNWGTFFARSRFLGNKTAHRLLFGHARPQMQATGSGIAWRTACPLGLLSQFPDIPVCEPYRFRRSFPSDGLR